MGVNDSMPDELWDELASAELRWEELAERGHSLRFRLLVPNGVAVDVCDEHGRRIASIAPAAAIGIACGAVPTASSAS
jgi:hypothetical protein